MFRWIACACFVLSLACAAGVRVASVHPASAREIQRLERLARTELHCPMPLRVTSLEAGAYALDGCGTSREYAHVCRGRRCVFEPIVPAVLRASSDLQCAPELLTAAAESPSHRAFFGCARGAAYVLVCVEHGCTWSRTPEVVAIASSVPSAVGAGAVVPSAVVPPSTIGDPSLADVAIPPPPGAAPPPPPPTTGEVVIPPPPS